VGLDFSVVFAAYVIYVFLVASSNFGEVHPKEVCNLGATHTRKDQHCLP
jgi:hypothetical protein